MDSKHLESEVDARIHGVLDAEQIRVVRMQPASVGFEKQASVQAETVRGVRELEGVVVQESEEIITEIRMERIERRGGARWER